MRFDSSTAPSSLRLLRNAIGRRIVLRTTTSRFAREGVVTEAAAILIEIHVEDGTVTAQDAAGNLFRVGRWEWTTRTTAGTFWHWPEADPPEDPKEFKPTHFPRGGPPKRAA